MKVNKLSMQCFLITLHRRKKTHTNHKTVKNGTYTRITDITNDLTTKMMKSKKKIAIFKLLGIEGFTIGKMVCRNHLS